jgi:ribosomal protein S18 acetylase RimI-like enzyme
MPEIAAQEPMSVEAMDGYRRSGRAWVLLPDGTSSATPVAYALVDLVDGAGHIEQISVDPAFARQGLGRRLIDHLAAEARREARTALTLTTFRDVPWNAPYYGRCGFRELAESELGPELRAKRDDEATHGLDPALRVCMRRDLV